MKANKIIAASMTLCMLASFTGCSLFVTKIDVDSLDKIDEDEWIDALEEIGLTESDYYAYENDYFTFDDGTRFDIVYEVDAESAHCVYYYSRFASTEEAEALYEYYEELYYNVFHSIGGTFSGTKGIDSDNDSGYIVLNGDFEKDKSNYCPYYDILIWKDDVVIMAYLSNINSTADVNSAKAEIDEFLDALGYPKP